MESDLAKTLADAEKWLRECSAWMLANDLDMNCPMEADPLDLADDLETYRTGKLIALPDDAVSLAGYIRSTAYPTDDDYWEVRRDERERVISALTKGADQ